jgi:DNA-binding protein HU-beta
MEMDMAKAVPKDAASAKTETGRSPKPGDTHPAADNAAEIAGPHGLSKKQAEAVLNETVTRISKGIVKGQRVRFGTLGIFSMKKLPARKGRNTEGRAIATS